MRSSIRRASATKSARDIVIVAVGGEAELGDGGAVAHDRHQERERLAGR